MPAKRQPSARPRVKVFEAPKLRTIGQVFRYTFEHKWGGTSGEEPNRINADVVMEIFGASCPVKHVSEAWFWNQLRTEYKKLKPKNSPATLNRVTGCLKTAVKFTRIAGCHTHVEHQASTKIPEKKVRFSYYTREAVEQFHHYAWDHLEDPYLAHAIYMAVYTGMRQGEMLRLRCADIDFDREVPVIWVGGNPDLGQTTKNGDYREMPICPELNDSAIWLKRHCSRRDQNLFAQYEPTKAGGKLLRDHFRLILELPCFGDKYANKKQFTWHTLRHTFATWLGEANSSATVAEIGGWKDRKMVERYCHATDAAKQRAINTFGKAVAAGQQTPALPSGLDKLLTLDPGKLDRLLKLAAVAESF
mgnify:CR=1 FL=1